MSLTFQILQAVARLSGDQGIPVRIRKLPKAEEVIDAALPIIAIYPGNQPFAWKRIAFGNQVQNDYVIGVTLIAPGNRDFVTGIDPLSQVIENIKNNLKTPSALNIPQVWQTKIQSGLLFDRDKLADGYDYLGLSVICSSAE